MVNDIMSLHFMLERKPPAFSGSKQYKINCRSGLKIVYDRFEHFEDEDSFPFMFQILDMGEEIEIVIIILIPIFIIFLRMIKRNVNGWVTPRRSHAKSQVVHTSIIGLAKTAPGRQIFRNPCRNARASRTHAVPLGYIAANTKLSCSCLLEFTYDQCETQVV